MNVLTPPRPTVVEDALALATLWCSGHVIDGAPALRHACAVAVLLGEHLPGAPPELIAAVLLHDSPEYAGQQLAETVRGTLGPRVLELIRAIDGEHQAMAAYRRNPAAAISGLETLAVERPDVFAASCADKAVSFSSILRRGDEAADPAGFWRGRQAFLLHMPYFRAFAERAKEVAPAGLAAELSGLVARAERAAWKFPPG